MFFLETSHLKGRWPLCISWCLFILDFWLNVFFTNITFKRTQATMYKLVSLHIRLLTECFFLQTSHLKGRRPLCISWCLFILDFWLNVFLLTSHVKGRWPLCISWCLFILDFWLNVFLQTSHVKGRRPLCISWCLFILDFWLNVFLLTAHLKGRRPLCISWCLFILDVWLIVFFTNITFKRTQATMYKLVSLHIRLLTECFFFKHHF